jgi:hypothetical protein
VLADSEEGVDLSAEDFVDKLWLLAATLLLIMVSGEELLDRGRLEKITEKAEGANQPSSGRRTSWVGFINRQSLLKLVW